MSARYRVLFPVRRQYFDQIVAGTKDREVRRLTKRWATVGKNVRENLLVGVPPVAVFLCGRRVHRRLICGSEIHVDAVAALGRKPSEQGRADLGDGQVVAFYLGGVAL